MSMRVRPASFLMDLHFWSPESINIISMFYISCCNSTSGQVVEGLVGQLVDLVDHFRQLLVEIVSSHDRLQRVDGVLRDLPLPLETEESQVRIIPVLEI